MAYPTDFDTFTTKNAGDTIMNTHVNALQTSVVAIEVKLGSGSPLSASTNTALLGTGASSTGYRVISLANSSLVTGTLTSERGGTGVVLSNNANGVVILDASGLIKNAQFGARVDVSAAEDHDNELAATDGIVEASNGNGDTVIGYSDTNNPPTTVRQRNKGPTGESASISMPVRKGERWKTTGDTTTFWMPVGS